MAGRADALDSDAKGSSASDVHEHGAAFDSDSDTPTRTVGLPDSPSTHPSRRLVHFYIDVPNGEDST